MEGCYDEWVDGLVERMDRVDGLVDGWVDSLVDEWMNGLVGEWMGWVNGCVGEWTDGWMHG